MVLQLCVLCVFVSSCDEFWEIPVKIKASANTKELVQYTDN